MNSLYVRIMVVVAATLLTLFIAALHGCTSKIDNQETYYRLNRNLDAAGVQFYQREAEVVNLLGDGEYMPGFGGHGRDYKDKGIRVSFIDDPDGMMYGRVSSIDYYGADCSIYGIKQGDAITEAETVLLKQNYKKLENQGFVYKNGEYWIMLQGNQQVNAISVDFRDERLMDRNY
ncbi:hypothetical protein PCCS19_43760 [Paenibacillus sp. CCS19]|uniref:hypothetical protein n=1 Tax=Paenibacillus sp. CCS19 TaxID=3158387 RepID=UPI0025653ADB|nr:hypothetical protein [Paenibacillus cellulosilyticus]GMK41320.1 hypothetical protein PCCS19_43760 [Paenibacillus cellulosilyticus]